MKKIFLSIIFFMISFQTFADINTTEITILTSNLGEINLSNKTDNYDLDIKIPLTDNQFLNKTVNNYVNNYISDFKIRTNNFEKLSNNWKYELNISGEKNIVGTITTYKLTIYEFTGGAHGSTIIKTFNFSKDGKKITLKDQNLLSKISAFSINYYKDLLKNGKIDTQIDWIDEGLKPDVLNFKNFIITKNEKYNLSIEFIFDQYQIAPYYEGNKTIDINLKQLK